MPLISALCCLFFASAWKPVPTFFDFFPRRENYLMLALVMVGSAMLIAMVLGKVFGWDIGSPPVCWRGHDLHPGAGGRGDTLRHFGLPSDQLAQSLTI
jgi:putative transport protein